jgi:hypothetical protein
MKMEKRAFRIIFILFFLFSITSLQAESKNFIDKENGYNVITEVSYIGKNLTKEDISSYSEELLNWCNLKGKNTKKIEKLTKERDWGWQKAISEYDAMQGETYVIRMFSVNNSNDTFTCMTLLLLTVTNSSSNSSEKYDFQCIYETDVDISQNETVANEDAGQKYYEDSTLGFSGHTTANYIGIDLNQDEINAVVSNVFNFANSDGYKAKEVSKLTEEQSWLIGQSLINRKLRQGETYSIAIIPAPKSFPTTFTALVIVVTIKSIDEKNGRFSYNYTAFESIQLAD